ncbi:hypothetical protein SAMN03159439_04841 [Pseudomonas sp. NFACC04-2]|nr:hypothetical protein SAMN03159439_04841 [Pseudomonas sp. NFACC04-2]
MRNSTNRSVRSVQYSKNHLGSVGCSSENRAQALKHSDYLLNLKTPQPT